ncbi:hypothetical protein [Pallidibacillus thermolactis]
MYFSNNERYQVRLNGLSFE